MVKITQLNRLYFNFHILFNKLQSTTPECYFGRFLPVLKQNALITAVKITVNKPNSHFTFEFGNRYIECFVLHILMRVQEEIR